MVQRDEGLWLHRPDRRHAGRVRPHQRRRARGSHDPQRRSGAQLRPRARPRQDVGRQPQGRLSVFQGTTKKGPSRGPFFMCRLQRASVTSAQ